MEDHQYLGLFDSFIKEYNENISDPRRAGEILARMSQYYANYNMSLVKAEKEYALVSRDIESRIENGKPISSAKAKVLSEATEEAFKYNEAKAHLQNIEQFINSIKTIAKLISNEYNVMGNI